MSTPHVSVIIPAYNAARFIGEAVQSALRQSYHDLEVIVVDDGSNDETAAVVEAIALHDSRIVVLRQQNRGVAAARNLAIRHARGEFIAPLDADDCWYKVKLERQLARMREAGPGVAMVYAGWTAIDEYGALLPDVATVPSAEGDLSDVLVWSNPIACASAPLIRRRCLDEIGSYSEEMVRPGVQGCEDWDLYLRIAERYHVAVVREYLLNYRNVADSMSGDVGAMWRSYELMMGRLLRRRPGIPQRLLRRSRWRFCLYLAGQSRQRGEPGQALSWMARSVASDPVGIAASCIRKIYRMTLAES